MILGHNMLSINVKHRWFHSIPFWDSGKMWVQRPGVRSRPYPISALSLWWALLSLPSWIFLTYYNSRGQLTHSHVYYDNFYAVEFQIFIPNSELAPEFHTRHLTWTSNWHVQNRPCHPSSRGSSCSGGPCLSEWYPIYPSSRISFFTSWSHSSALL